MAEILSIVFLVVFGLSLIGGYVTLWVKHREEAKALAWSLAFAIIVTGMLLTFSLSIETLFAS